MSLLQKIAESQGAAQAKSSEDTAALAVESERPDAVVQDNNQRAAFGNELAMQGPVEMQEEQADPAEQEAFSVAERDLAENIFGPASNKLVTAIKSNKDPVNGIGEAAALIITKMTSKHKNLTEDALLELGQSAIEQIVELAETSISGLDLSQEQMAEAMSIGVGKWSQFNPDQMGPQDDYRAETAPSQLGEGSEKVKQPESGLSEGPQAAPQGSPIQNIGA